MSSTTNNEFDSQFGKHEFIYTYTSTKLWFEQQKWRALLVWRYVFTLVDRSKNLKTDTLQEQTDQ